MGKNHRGFSLAVIIVIGSLIGGSSYYFNQSNVADQQAKAPLTYTEDPTSTHTTPSTSAKEVELPLIMTTEVAITTPALAEEITEDETAATALIISGETTERIEADTALQTSLKENSTSVDQLESNVKKVSSTTPSTPEKLTIITSVNSEIVPKEIITESSSSIENTDPALLFTQSKTGILSEHVKRFIISPLVKTNEPAGTINDIIF